MPAVIVVTEHFTTLANVVLKSQQVPESVAVIIPPNPESLDDDALAKLAERVLATSWDYARASRLTHWLHAAPEHVDELPNGVDAARFSPGVDGRAVRARYGVAAGERVVLFVGAPLIRLLMFSPKMAEKAISMLKRSMQALVNRDAKTASAICNEDDEVDKLYDEAYHNLLMMMIKDPTLISKATPLIWAAHNLERSADRVTNICERIIFLATGSMPQVNVSKY